MKIEVGKFGNGELMVRVRFEPSSNFRREDNTWVPTFEEIDLIVRVLLGIDGMNRFVRRYDK